MSRPDKLEAKLVSYEIPIPLILLIRSFLTNKSNRVIHKSAGAELSDRCGSFGVPQGTLGNIFVHDLSMSSTLVKHADDASVFSVIPKHQCQQPSQRTSYVKARRALQLDTDAITNWSTENQTTINTKEMKSMPFMLRNKMISSLITVNNECIEEVETFKLRGVTISEHISFALPPTSITW